MPLVSAASTLIGRSEDVVPLTNQSWRQHAACRGVEPDVFYPVSDEEADIAKAICDQCSVRQTCLEYALTNRERDGVWGGATERERRRLLRQRRRSA
jgi:WhiB family redox-sensing transcriptional regulator